MSVEDATPSNVLQTPPPTRALVLLERLLSPQGIHALFGVGGGLFVVGLVTWLATLGIFDHPLVLATALGVGNLVVLGAGFWLVLTTRYQLAGLALSLLACLVMPLHLWFYHAQYLLTLDNHLWVAALVISALYAASARVLKNFWFVPVFLGGLALTSLLILADLGQFWQITAPAITLCALGLLAIHLERFFPDDDTPFRRARFGLAFFWSGHALLGLGLLMVLVAQLAGGPLYETYTKSLYQQWSVTPTELVTTTNGKWLALFLVAVGVYAHLYSDLVVRRKGYYLQIAAGLVLWMEFIVLDLLDITFEKEALLGILAATGMVMHLLHRVAGKQLPMQAPILPFLALILTLGATLGGLLLYLADGLRYVGIAEANLTLTSAIPTLLVSMVIALAANLMGYWASRERVKDAHLYREAAALTVLLLAGLVVALVWPATWMAQAWTMLLLMSGAVVIAWRVPTTRPLGQLAHLFVLLWLGLGLRQLLIFGGDYSLQYAGLLGTAAGFYLLTVLLLHHRAAAALAVACAVGALIHLFTWFEFALAYKLLASATLGAFVSAMGFVQSRREHEGNRVGLILVRVGQAVFFLSLLGTGLLSAQHVLAQRHDDPRVWSVFYALLAQAGLAVLFYVKLARTEPTRNLYLVFTLAHLALAGFLLVMLLDLPMWRKVELASVALGLTLTMLGFIAWAKEEAGAARQDSLSVLFLFGCLLSGVPLALTVLNYRSAGQFHLGDEASMLVIGLVLLAGGCVCQLRIPTIAGAALTLLYLFGLLLFVPWGHLGSAALILAGGGASIFLLGLALSLFRDRLLSLPARVKERRGVFQVLSWR
jgi:hypothetical protein